VVDNGSGTPYISSLAVPKVWPPSLSLSDTQNPPLPVWNPVQP